MIGTASAPVEATRSAHAALASLALSQASALELREAGGGPQPCLHDPIAVYFIALPVLNEGTSARDARQIGWRYVVSQGDDLRTVDVDGSGAESRVVAITRGGAVTNLVNASTLAERSAQGPKRYEVRILELGRAGPGAVWLRADEGADRFFSLEVEPREITERDLLDGASRKAATRRSLYQRPEAASNLAPDRRDDEMGG